MAQWMQCDFIQTTPVWADAACNVRPDTHDGADSNIRKRVEDVPGFDEPKREREAKARQQTKKERKQQWRRWRYALGTSGPVARLKGGLRLLTGTRSR